MENKINVEEFEKVEKLAAELSDQSTNLESLLENCSSCTIDNPVIYKMIADMKRSVRKMSSTFVDIILDADYIKRCLTGQIRSDPFNIPECNLVNCKTEEERKAVKERYKATLKENGFDVENREVY